MSISIPGEATGARDAGEAQNTRPLRGGAYKAKSLGRRMRREEEEGGGRMEGRRKVGGRKKQNHHRGDEKRSITDGSGELLLFNEQSCAVGIMEQQR